MTDSKSLATLQTFLDENKSLGIENMSSEDLLTPYLKVTQFTTKDVDEQGNRLPVGKLFYSGTKTLRDETKVTLLTYVKVQTPSIADKTKLVKQYKVAGVLNNNKLPFIMFFGGTAIGSLKKYFTEVTRTQRPLFSLSVTMKVEKRDGDKGEYFVPIFENMELINDIKELQIFKGLTVIFKELLHTANVYEEPDLTENLGQDIDPAEVKTDLPEKTT